MWPLAIGVFATNTVANGKTVTVSGITIGGADAANYALTQPAPTANITRFGPHRIGRYRKQQAV